MKKIFIILFFCLFCCSRQGSAQMEKQVLKPVSPHEDVFGILQQMKPQKKEIVPVTVDMNVTKIKKPELNLRAQIEEVKAACPFVQQRKTSLKLNGERFDNSLVNLDWERKNGYDDRLYFVQRSIGDTGHFETVSLVWAEARFRSKEKYEKDDANDHAGISYYRLKLSDVQNQSVFSNIVEVKGYGLEKLNISPNPAASNAWLQLETTWEGRATLQVTDINGRLLKQEPLLLHAGVNTSSINTSRLVQGVYIIKIIKADKSFVTGKLVKD
jgi:hypothetical protein